jgi:hypothetical protein
MNIFPPDSWGKNATGELGENSADLNSDDSVTRHSNYNNNNKSSLFGRD